MKHGINDCLDLGLSLHRAGVLTLRAATCLPATVLWECACCARRRSPHKLSLECRLLLTPSTSPPCGARPGPGSAPPPLPPTIARLAPGYVSAASAQARARARRSSTHRPAAWCASLREFRACSPLPAATSPPPGRAAARSGLEGEGPAESRCAAAVACARGEGSRVRRCGGRAYLARLRPDLRRLAPLARAFGAQRFKARALTGEGAADGGKGGGFAHAVGSTVSTSHVALSS